MADDTIEFGAPDVKDEGGNTWRYLWNRNNGPVMGALFQDVRNDGDSVYADITVWWLLDQPMGVPPVQPRTTLKLNSSHSTGWRSIPRELGKRFPNVDIEGAMTWAVWDAMEKFERGEPTVALFEGTTSTEAPFLLEPWISSRGITTLYGEGGLSKSLVTLAMGISVATGVPIFGREPIVTGPVILFDYEDDDQTHVDRLLAICKSFGIPPEKAQVYHHSLTSKVSTSYREMQKRAHEVGAVLGILDSVGMGRGGSAIAAEDTIRLYRYLRTIGMPFLCIDHISKEAKDKKSAGDRDAYGSVYSMNSVRLGWSLARQLDGKDDGILMYAANTKHNHVPKQKSQTLRVKYENDEKGIPHRIDIEVGTDFGLMMPTVDNAERMMMYLSHGGWSTYTEMEDSLGIKASTLRSIVSRDGGVRFETRGVTGMPTEVRLIGGVATTVQHPLQHPHPEEESE